MAAVVLVTIAAAGSVGTRFLIEFLVTAIEDRDNYRVMVLAMLYPTIFFGFAMLWRISSVVAQNWLLGAPKQTVDRLMSYTNKHSHSYFANRFAGSLSNKISNVSSAMEEFVGLFLWDYLEQFIPVLLTGVIFLYTDVLVGGLYFALIVSSIILNLWLMKRKRIYSLALANAQSKTTGLVVDVMSNVQAVRQYVRSTDEYQSVAKQTEDVRTKGRRSFLYSEYMMFANSLLFTVFAVGMFSVMVQNWITEEVTSGRLLSFILLLTYTSGTVLSLGRVISRTAKVYGRAEEGLQEVLVDHEVIDAPDAKALRVSSGALDICALTFAYQEKDIFTDLTLDIPPGQRVGLVGPSGAGKSTFVSLLLRQHDLNGGSIEIDGQNIAEVTQDSLRQNIAFVPQEPMLFHRSIRENILYGKLDASEAEMIEAAMRANAHDFIIELPDGYDTLVGERGVKLSGGQKQRVAIARAMLKQAPILILDEATSALDSESESLIQSALEELMEGKTVLAIAHRLSTLRKMDRILVFENGRIIEDGTHAELTKASGTYSRLWKHQSGGFLVE